MPWNQPGSGPDKDPWGQKNKQQGPPDLDKVIKDIKDKLGASFGGNRRGSGGDTTKGSNPASKGMFFLIGLVALGFWLASGFYKVDAGSKAIELQFGALKRVTGPGLHWHIPSPIESKHIHNTEAERKLEIGFRSQRGGSAGPVAEEALMLTEDENIIDIHFSVLYDISSVTDLFFNVAEDPERVVRQATESAAREIIGKNTMDFAITEGRSAIASETQTLLQQILDGYRSGLNVRQVVMESALPPREVKAAFDDAVSAREDKVREINIAEAYARDIIPRARGLVARIDQDAEAYEASVIAKATGEASRFDQVREEYIKAPQVTRDRLYLDTMESVLGSSSKMVIDQQKGGNSVMYLPLDKMIENSRNQGTPSAASSAGAAIDRVRSQNNSAVNQSRTSNRSSSR